MTRNKQSIIHIRVSAETRMMLDRLAGQSGRTVTNWIEWVIRSEHDKTNGDNDNDNSTGKTLS